MIAAVVRAVASKVLGGGVLSTSGRLESSTGTKDGTPVSNLKTLILVISIPYNCDVAKWKEVGIDIDNS